MNWRNLLKTRRVRDLERLVEIQQRQIESFQRQKNPSGQYVVCQVPSPSDMQTYYEKVAAIVTDPFYIFWITQLRRSTVDGFEMAPGENAEFYRGQLAMLGMMISDARKAKSMISEEVPNAL